MHRLTRPFLMLALVAACSAPSADRQASYHNRGTEIYSNAVLDPARLQGDWQQVGAFGPAGGCTPGGVRFGAAAAGSLPVEAQLCLGGRGQAFRGTAVMPVTGRLQLQGAEGSMGQPWWVLWADVNDRTLVIGTPSGEMGFILNRGGPLPPDRLNAAREILEWNGYDLSKLQMF